MMPHAQPALPPELPPALQPTSASPSPPGLPAPTMATFNIALVGPLPPPAGGMANQTRQLAGLLRQAGATVELVPVNPAWRWSALARVRGVRALVRLAGYLPRLWQAAGRAGLVHIMANSGWSWHLHAAPAIWIARLRGKSVLVNYRGGEAETFLARQGWLVCLSLRRAHAVAVPSAYLAGVFARHGIAVAIVPNIIDTSCFHPLSSAPAGHRSAPLILVPRHLEPLYDNASALRALAIVKRSVPGARMVMCGEGAELARLRTLAHQLGLASAVEFAGRQDRDAMAALLRRSDAVLNPALADNMPNSVLEALASGVPVVSTDVGGVPFLLRHNVTGLLVAPRDVAAMAHALLSLLRDPVRARQLADAGLALARQFTWDAVQPLLAAQYRRVLRRPGVTRGRGAYAALVSGVLFPLHEQLKHHTSVLLRRQLEQSQWWPAERLAALRLQRLRTLLLHAATHVPYYREQYAALGFDPRQLTLLDQLQQLPLLHKADINTRRDGFVSDQAPPLQRLNTGGSSGEPLVFFVGKARVSHDVAAKWRATRWWGVDLGDREAVLWGSPIELKAQDRWRARRDYLFRTRLLPAFDLSPARLDNYLAQLRCQPPAMLFGYPSALCRLASHAMQQAGAAPLAELGVKVVFVTAERLYPEQRTLLEQAFGCPVANGYGGRDAGFIAHQCPDGGMHISAEDIIVEIVDGAGHPVAPGDTGEIVVTHLASGDFPLIRYATGDVGALDPRPCPCGRGLPLLSRLEGRVSDFVVAHDGTVMHGLALIYVLRDLPQVRAFKIIQESLALTRVLLVSADGAPLTAALRQTIVLQFQARLGAGVDIVIDEVAAIAVEASGKHRYVVSHVHS